MSLGQSKKPSLKVAVIQGQSRESSLKLVLKIKITLLVIKLLTWKKTLYFNSKLAVSKNKYELVWVTMSKYE